MNLPLMGVPLHTPKKDPARPSRARDLTESVCGDTVPFPDSQLIAQ